MGSTRSVSTVRSTNANEFAQASSSAAAQACVAGGQARSASRRYPLFYWKKVACGAFFGPSAPFAAAKSAVFAAYAGA
jgi:hypothetical protein